MKLYVVEIGNGYTYDDYNHVTKVVIAESPEMASMMAKCNVQEVMKWDKANVYKVTTLMWPNKRGKAKIIV